MYLDVGHQVKKILLFWLREDTYAQSQRINTFDSKEFLSILKLQNLLYNKLGGCSMNLYLFFIPTPACFWNNTCVDNAFSSLTYSPKLSSLNILVWEYLSLHAEMSIIERHIFSLVFSMIFSQFDTLQLSFVTIPLIPRQHNHWIMDAIALNVYRASIWGKLLEFSNPSNFSANFLASTLFFLKHSIEILCLPH